MFLEFVVFVWNIRLVPEPTENVCEREEGNWPMGSEIYWELLCG